MLTRHHARNRISPAFFIAVATLSFGEIDLFVGIPGDATHVDVLKQGRIKIYKLLSLLNVEKFWIIWRICLPKRRWLRGRS